MRGRFWLIAAALAALLTGGGAIAAVPSVADTLRALASKLDGEQPKLAENAEACGVGSTAVSTQTGDTRPSIESMMAEINNIQIKENAKMKDLPNGKYRDRCFGCLNLPDYESGSGRVLSCVCAVRNEFARLTLPLDTCKLPISYCGEMLVCGECKVGNLDNSLVQAPPSSSEAVIQNMLKQASPLDAP